MPDNDLGLAMLELKMALEKFAEAFTAAVARDLKRQVEILAAAYPPVPVPCPIEMPHGPHDGCTGRTSTAHEFKQELDKLERACPRRDTHLDHTWSFPRSSGRWKCPGVKPADKLQGEQCPDNLAHHEHQWSVAGPVDGDPVPVASLVRWCQGLEEDLEVQWCGGQAPDTGNLTHAAHTWGHSEGARVVVFCRGRRELLERQCSRILAHTAHTHSIPIDEDRSVTYRCPGTSGPLVPAGSDRHA